ncbi:MAG: ribosome biogenesis GTP-binding protein YihA/YsxC [Gammaproteobacteria bacterium]|nr:ribosome biogenesis GTP-binding protein YihA/YsxC [Gammaproteobacteria bacterium]MCY4210717.1 ribosome biogenesis GTP-binding protein YihA/YsxC [Gammaproteobacteria bacterium]MCY4281973.1 ribosome biogenesis GTP-binding protein YihA/YsxC [Gammaproteobacteria bacterium]MCY4337464.1 ribosome biogenesis GTP-binding protein YihA/YsxC [Gammaproteobacteria bacterium]
MNHSRYHNTVYLQSAHLLTQLPADAGKEVVFAGRSNAGKSSVLNALARRKSLARTSRQPGRTRQLNFFVVDAQARLVDLPGYGYAKAPRDLRQHWGQLINTYLAQRQCLTGLALIVDIRRGLGDPDRQLLNWCTDRALPAQVVLNKADKLSRSAAAHALTAVARELGENTGIQLFSATKKQGLDELYQTLDKWL